MAKIQDYALIGNARSAALISKEGALDWLCWPTFDSPSLFGAILDPDKGGTWKIFPTLSHSCKRHYIGDTNVLVTNFYSESGQISLTDFMPICSEEEKKKSLFPENELIRKIDCLYGSMEIEIIFCPRPRYGVAKQKISDKGTLGLRIEGNPLFSLHGPCSFNIDAHTAVAKLTLNKGDKLAFSLTCHTHGPAILVPLDEKSIAQKLQNTVIWWQNWAKRIAYEGEYREQVVRSALVLKLLYFAPSGTFIAAPTTSLPEKVGGKLNWDYRYSWVRDASFITQALFGLALHEDAHPFIDWLLYSTKLSSNRLDVYCDVYGRYCGKEKELDHLAGYEGSRPVRIGNAASMQFQLDIYGEVIEAVSLYIRHEGRASYSLAKEMLSLGRYVCKNWRRPDNGIWEARGERKNYTYSLLMCWQALNKLLENSDPLDLTKKTKAIFKKNQNAIQETLRTQCWNPKLNSYTTIQKEEQMGASLLQLAIRNFESPTSSRMVNTYAKINERLQVAPALYYRNEKSIERGEGSFQICNFWNIEYLARGGGMLEEAKKAFRRILSTCNDVGLLSEEVDPVTLEALGNFPLGLSHAGLINAALAIAKREKP